MSGLVTIKLKSQRHVFCSAEAADGAAVYGNEGRTANERQRKVPDEIRNIANIDLPVDPHTHHSNSNPKGFLKIGSCFLSTKQSGWRERLQDFQKSSMFLIPHDGVERVPHSSLLNFL